MQEEILKGLIAELIQKFTAPILLGLKKVARDANDKTQVILNLCFSEYLQRNYERYSKTKTLLYREMPVDLKNFYVRTDLEINSDFVDENKFISEVEKKKRLIILGGAGSGKSTFCKSLFIELIEKPIGIFPIFIELRHLNNANDKSLYDFILDSLIAINPSFNKIQLEYAFKLGKVLIILDGFDEINREKRENIEKEILYLSNNYHGMRVLVSSRFDNRFSSWEEFYQYRISELDKNKALTLINKLNYDRQVKQSFLNELDSKLYNSHKSFASNPLLLTMMLLTYEQIAEIPNKIHLFYEQAFLTLFNKHDSLKSLYKRKSFSGLPLDDFKRCLEVFCILSYCDGLYFFEENKIKKYINSAIKISKVNCVTDDFLSDLLDSVCIIQRDGLGFSFTHRSFQEYFTAQFLVNKTIQRKSEIFDKVYTVNGGDNIFSMIYDVNSDLIEKEWVIPKIDKIYFDFNALSKQSNSELKILSNMYSCITLIDDTGSKEKLGFRLSNISRFYFFLKDFYKDGSFDFYNIRQDVLESCKDQDFEDQLINYIKEHGDIDLIETNRIDPLARELIKKAKLGELVLEQIKFLKDQANLLKKKHEKQDVDIFSLLLH
ncbi:NACHT domain-containing protein [Acinetobacter brisouii]